MEKKTIGGFLAALRKANGMTQRELAERLNVSDKTVSRWERDDGTPELALIPIIAEIFDVTCDELLRGERRSPAERAGAAGESESTPKGEKQRQRLLRSALSQYQSRTFIAMGISVGGLIAALIANLAFLKAVLGFLLGALFFAASIVCQAVFLNRAFLSVEDAGVEEAPLSAYRRSVIRLAQRSIGLTVALIGFTFPLILVDAYFGLGTDSLLIWGSAGAAAFLLLYAVVLYFFNASLLKRGIYSLPAQEAAVYHHNHRLKRTCAIILAALLAATCITHLAATSIWGPRSIMRGTVFEDYDSFIEYMGRDISAPMDRYFSSETAAEPLEPAVYYDEYGNEISEEEALTHRLEDQNGTVVCEYVDRNESVVSIRYSPKDGTVLPITVFTQEDLQAAQQLAAVRHVIFAAAYGVEILAILLIYFKKRAKRST